MTAIGPPASYLTVEPGMPVLSCDGEPLGTLAHVLADHDAGNSTASCSTPAPCRAATVSPTPDLERKLRQVWGRASGNC